MQTIISNDISKAITLLKNNEVVAIPTETVYGLAGNAFDENAVRKIFEAKNRPTFNPLIIHIGNIDQLKTIAQNVPEIALKLAKKYWPGPLTLVLDKQTHIPDLVTGNLKTVGIRMPNHPVALALLNQIDFPLAAPSANPFGGISPTQSKHVKKGLEGKIPVVLEGGQCAAGIESTILGFINNQPIIYREGIITHSELESFIGPVLLKNHNDQQPEAPGMLGSHYAPKTKSVLTSDLQKAILENSNQKIGVLSFSKTYEHPNIQKLIVLSANENTIEAAQKLYDAMHELDESNCDLLIFERLPNNELGNSINDRLTRATF